MTKLSKPFLIFVSIGFIYSLLGISIEKPFIQIGYETFVLGRLILASLFFTILILHITKKIKLQTLSEIFLILMMAYAVHGQWYIPMYYLAYLQAILLIPLLLPLRLNFLKLSMILGFLSISSCLLYSPSTYIDNPIFNQKFIYDSIVSVLIFTIGTYASYKYNLKTRKEKDLLFNKFIDIGKNSSFLIHDFKGLTATPLFYTQYLEKIIDKEIESVSKKQKLHLINKLKNELNDINNYSREITQITLPDTNTTNKLLDIEEIIIGVSIILRKQLDGIKLEFNKNDKIFYNKNKLKKIISNLILNSIESLKENKIKNPSIKISCKDNKIEIRDNGIGFDKKILKKLNSNNIEFITSKLNGSGLGISVTKELIQNDNGIINFKNDNGAIILINLNNLIKKKKS